MGRTQKLYVQRPWLASSCEVNNPNLGNTYIMKIMNKDYIYY